MNVKYESYARFQASAAMKMISAHFGILCSFEWNILMDISAPPVRPSSKSPAAKLLG
jgi:hypothetical protein